MACLPTTTKNSGIIVFRFFVFRWKTSVISIWHQMERAILLVRIERRNPKRGEIRWFPQRACAFTATIELLSGMRTGATHGRTAGRWSARGGFRFNSSNRPTDEHALSVLQVVAMEGSTGWSQRYRGFALFSGRYFLFENDDYPFCSLSFWHARYLHSSRRHVFVPVMRSSTLASVLNCYSTFTALLWIYTVQYLICAVENLGNCKTGV